MRELVSLRDALEQTIKGLGLKKAIFENKAVSCWKEAVGQKIAAQSEAQKIKNGVLYVKTKNPVWSQQLSLMSEELKDKINKQLGAETVKQIRFRS